MPIKLTGSLSMQDIVNEFGGSKPYDINDYYRGGDFVPNKNVNSKIPLKGSGQPISIGDFYGATKLITLESRYVAGGGAGGSGFENNSTVTSSAGYGERSGIMRKSEFDRVRGTNPLPPTTANRAWFLDAIELGYPAGSSFPKVTTPRTEGGQNNYSEDVDAADGQSSQDGPGGAGGARNTAGSRPQWGNWGAGGGGGGGDQGNGDKYVLGIINRGGGDEWGKAGQRGFAGVVQGAKADMDVSVDYVVRIGGGGLPAANVGNHDGGAGAPGYLEFSIDTQPNHLFVFEPQKTGPIVFGTRVALTADWTSETYYVFRIDRDSTIVVYRWNRDGTTTPETRIKPDGTVTGYTYNLLVTGDATFGINFIFS